MNDKKITKYEKAHHDYNLGMKYKDIAAKYGVAENTVKTWKKRYDWKPRVEPKKVSEVQTVINVESIRSDLLNQLNDKGIKGAQYIDLTDTYIDLFIIKEDLIKDVKKRGVSVIWENGKQSGFKKNDSISEINKTITVMLSILNYLDLKPVPGTLNGYEDTEL